MRLILIIIRSFSLGIILRITRSFFLGIILSFPPGFLRNDVEQIPVEKRVILPGFGERCKSGRVLQKPQIQRRRIERNIVEVIHC